MSQFIMENRNYALFAVIAMASVSAAYFMAGKPYSASMSSQYAVYDGIELKFAPTLEGEPKLFAYASPGALYGIPAADGSNMPTDLSMVLGSSEASMMRKEKLISGTGSNLDGFFGINTSIAGVLSKTGGPLDMMHFLSRGQFESINGEKRVSLFFLGKMPKLFFYLGQGESLPGFRLAEGSMENYAPFQADGKTYYPIAIGADEAAMMRKERLFSKPGDRLTDFFGSNVHVVGVLERTGGAYDMMHFVPRESKIGN
jgi:hypothetical protein